MAREMKDSGIEWVGKIPVDWKVFPNKYIMKKVKEICFDWKGQPVMSLTIKGVIARDLKNPVGKMPLTFNGYQFIYSGELLMCLFDYDVTPRCIGRILQNGVTSPAYSRFKLYDNADLNYYYYYYLMIDNTKELLHLAKNLRHSFTEEQLGALNVPVPPLEEQQKIAEYLDRKIVDIDLIIEKTRTTIEDYKKYKQSIITEAVTKGLNPDTQMKESGIEWVGEIPYTWKVIPNKYVMKKEKEICFKWNNESVMSLTLNGVVVRDLENPVGKMPLTFNGYQFIYSGELLMCLFDYDVTPRCIGRILQNGVTSPAYSRFKLYDNADLNYYYYYYLMIDNTKELLHLAKNLRHSFTEEQLGALNVPVPPLEEQQQIAEYLDKKIANIDNLIAKKESLISEMEEYKKSLIYECVTGKKEIV